MKKVIIIAVAVLVLLAGYRIYAVKSKSKTAKSDYVVEFPVQVMKISRRTMSEKVTVSGNVSAVKQADIFAKVPGKLAKNTVREGDLVNVDQEIAMVDRDEPGIEFNQSPVKSTIDGVVLRTYMDPGARISPQGSPIATIGDITQVKIVVNVNEVDFPKIRTGMTAEVKLDSYPDTKWYGKITLVSSSIDLMSRTGKTEIIVNNKDGRLKPGMFAEVNIITKSFGGAIAVPIGAILEENDVKKVFIVQDNKAVEKIVRTGLTQDEYVEISGGLSGTESLIIAGQHRISNGSKIKVVTQ
jgi:multidrug efflux pump subunit AcrA (membrane-fusion protein)